MNIPPFKKDKIKKNQKNLIRIKYMFYEINDKFWINNNLSELTKNLKDYIIIKTVTTGTVSVSANTGVQPSYTIPQVDGYKLMYRFGVPNGDAGIIVQPNSTWIYNTTHSNASVTVTYYCVFVRDL